MSERSKSTKPFAPILKNPKEDQARLASRLAGVLFITATVSTMASQMIMEQIFDGSGAVIDTGSHLVALATLLELTNALASAGIAIALYPVFRQFAATAATGYLGLRIIEGALGVTATAGLVMIMAQDPAAFAQSLHDAMFLLVLIVFSCGTFLLYPVLFVFRLVPRILSVWGLAGGIALLLSCCLVLFERIEIGGTLDTILSLPIWINEMVLALWLLIRGLDRNGMERNKVP